MKVLFIQGPVHFGEVNAKMIVHKILSILIKKPLLKNLTLFPDLPKTTDHPCLGQRQKIRSIHLCALKFLKKLKIFKEKGDILLFEMGLRSGIKF